MCNIYLLEQFLTSKNDVIILLVHNCSLTQLLIETNSYNV